MSYSYSTKKYKSSQFIQIPFPTNGNTSFYVDTKIPIDRIRISCYGELVLTNFTPVITLYSDIVNNVIGTVAIDTISTATPFIFKDQLKPRNGIDFFFPYKVQLTGTYQLFLRQLDGSIPVADTGNVFLLIEYFIDD